ncbi:MAG: hypothetical protein NC293_13265 [Roseburia sp.]|nr:hypothetical protein [Roseburia sp.]
MKHSTLSRKKIIIILSVMILVQLAYITYTFGWQREGYHSDENWSYGFANAYYQAQLYCDEEGNSVNFNTWTSGDVFRDYLQVKKNQRFSYGSVAYNMAADFNPPLHSILLHTICSFFPDSFSWWYAYIINIIAFIGTMIGLYFLGKELTHSQKTALFICFYYGILSGALNTFIYLRTYALLTAFAVLYAWLHCRLYNKNFQKPLACLIGIFVLNILGGLGHYYFLAFAFCFAVIFFIYQMITKHFKTAGLYTLTMAASVGIVFLLWPHTLNLLIQGASDLYNRHMPLWWEVKTCFQFLIGESSGFLVYYLDAYQIAVFNVILIFLFIIAAGLSVLFRNEPWFRSFIRNTFQKTKHMFKALPRRIKRMNKKYLLLGLSILATLVIIAKVSNIYLMGIHFDRYLFFLMPITTALFVGVTAKLIRLIFKKFSTKSRTSLIIAFTLTGLIFNYIYFPCHYLFPRNNMNGSTIETITKDANVIIVTASDWHLVCYSTMLKDCRNFYAIGMLNFMDSLDSIDKLEDPSDSPVYLIIERNRLRSENWESDKSAPENMKPMEEALTYDLTISSITDRISSTNFATMCKFITKESGFVGTYEVYQLR